MTTIQERNRQILQMRQKGVPKKEVARRFKLSPTRICQIERRAAADKSMAERRAGLRAQIRVADDPEKLWPVNDLADAMTLIVVTKKRLLDHFEQTGQSQISLRALMDLCLAIPEEPGDFRFPPLCGICGIGKKGFWSVANGLTNMDLGNRGNEEWHNRLVKVKRNWGITGPTPYSAAM
jgi:hypothetical protein